jgi:basic amino acid/polyamine antiporter, APA family
MYARFTLLPVLTGFMAATSGAFSSYDGWYNITMVAGELENPRRNISRSLFIGVGACIAIYVLITLAYLYILPVSQVAHSTLVAADAMQKALGIAAAGMVSVLIVVSTFGATHVNYNDIVAYRSGQAPMIDSVVGIVLTAFGIPFYLYFQRKTRLHAQ